MKARNLAKLPNFKEFQYEVFKRSGKDSRTPGLPGSEKTQRQRECLLVSSTETFSGLHLTAADIRCQASTHEVPNLSVDTVHVVCEMLHPVSTRYHPKHRQQKSGSFLTVTVHGSFCGKEVGPIQHIEGDIDFKIYFNIMETVSSRAAQSGFILQQDNYPKHKSKLFTKWFHDNIVPLLLWLSRSPDFNPIGNLWDDLELQVKDPVAHREHEKFPQLTTA
ncbi:hypothetical protein TELCIR_25119 [Teladorsagia circumcincta]|uniref:Tc1-like transposase DDE domain-containing protein n=1 Tax=Teladorsagia circumcincta TaxID=45464 RepID=A0A2G9T6E3_TELCI|nr:hypothetical protein TELCIR_25119 [Teladorsagia circumcincta]